MRIIGIDPGSEKSAYVLYDTEQRQAVCKDHWDNETMRCYLASYCEWQHNGLRPTYLAIEQVCCYGVRVGRSVFDTVFWSGRFVECWGDEFKMLSKQQISQALCGKGSGINKTDIHNAIYDMFGGSRSSACGTKKKPGPLYGIKGPHLWDALAVALTCEIILKGGE